MEKITKTFTHDYENDTTIEYFNTGKYAGLTCSFTSEDPDYGTDTLHYNSEPADSMETLAYELREEIRQYLDITNDGISRGRAEGSELDLVYGEYSNSTLYAIENALTEIAKDYKAGSVKDEDGNIYQILTIEEAAKAIKETIIEDTNVKFDIGVGVCDHSSAKDYVTDGFGLYWYGVKMIPNDTKLFDGHGYYRDYIFMVGCYGGGNISMAYFNNEFESLKEWNAEELVKAICDSTGTERTDKILLETIKKEDK